MLERIHIENYKCLRDVTVDLGKFTILIGPNDSGKSSFVDAVRTLGQVTSLPFQNIFGDDRAVENLVWRRETQRSIVWDVSGTSSSDPFTYHVEIPVARQAPVEWLIFRGQRVLRSMNAPDGEGSGAYPGQPGSTLIREIAQDSERLWPQLKQLNGQESTALQLGCRTVRAAMESSAEFHFDPAKMSGPSVPTPNALLSPLGDNLAAFLDGLLSGPDRSAFAALEKDLHAAIPTLDGISLPAASNQAGAKCIRFLLAGNRSAPVIIPASLASGGALLLTAFLALTYSKTPDLLLFEEPENGLHPSRLQLVVDVLRKMTTGELGGRARQVIITTHNPLLLNYTKPEEVRIFVPDSERGTQVTPMAKVPDIDKLLKEFAVGELWYLLGEEKLLEGSAV